MEILRKNEGVSSYIEVRLDAADERVRYAENVFRNNSMCHIPGTEMQWVDGRLHLLYKTDGMTGIIRKWGVTGPGKAEVQRLLSELAEGIRELQDYLLPPEGLVLSLPYILYDKTEGHMKFLYAPEPGPTFSESMKHLFEEIMPVFDRPEDEEMVWLYDLYGRFLDGSFTPGMLIDMVSSRKGLPEAGRDRAGGGDHYCSGEDKGTRVQRGENDGPPVFGLPEPVRIPGTASSGPPGEKPEGFFASDRVWYAAGGISVLAAAGLLLAFGWKAVTFAVLIIGAYMVLLFCRLLSDDRMKTEKAERAGPATTMADTFVVQDPVPLCRASSSGTEFSGDPTAMVSGDEYPSTGVLSMTIHRLVPTEGGMRAPLYVSEGYCRIGRTEGENDYCIPAPAISRNHARLECSGDVVTLRDLGSTNGTYLNHVRLAKDMVTVLHYGDVVSFAGEEYYVV